MWLSEFGPGRIGAAAVFVLLVRSQLPKGFVDDRPGNQFPLAVYPIRQLYTIIFHTEMTGPPACSVQCAVSDGQFRFVTGAQTIDPTYWRAPSSNFLDASLNISSVSQQTGHERWSSARLYSSKNTCMAKVMTGCPGFLRRETCDYRDYGVWRAGAAFPEICPV